MIEKQKNIKTITIDNGKRYGKTKKITIEQRINWGTHTEIMDPLKLYYQCTKYVYISTYMGSSSFWWNV